MMDGDYGQLDIEAAATALNQALNIEKARSSGPITKTVEQLLADADLIWRWMAAEYQPPTPTTATTIGNGTLTVLPTPSNE